MTAFPEKVDVEDVFWHGTPRTAAKSAASGKRESTGSLAWRIVAEDGSTSTFDPALQGIRRTGDARTGRPSDRMESNIDMPTATPDLSEMFAADGATAWREAGELEKALSVPDSGPMAVAQANDRGVSSPTCARVPKAGTSGPLSPGAVAGSDSCGRGWKIDPQLARVIELWPGLPRGVRTAILAMTESVKDGG